MKKTTRQMATMVTLVFMLLCNTGCYKIVSYTPVSASQGTDTTVRINENGNYWQGWQIDSPAVKFDPAGDRIIFSDTVNNDGKTKLTAGLALPNDGPKVIYAVGVSGGTLANMRNELRRRGYKIAPLSYLIGLEKEYDSYSSFLWNLLCLDLPTTINFGTGEEEAGVEAWGPVYVGNSQNGGEPYDISLQFISQSTNWGTGMRVLVYK